MLWIVTADQSHVQGDTRPFRKLAEEAGDEIGAKPADVRLREIDVHDDERPARGVEGDVRQSLVGWDCGRSMPMSLRGMEGASKLFAQGLAGRRDFLVRAARGDLQRHVER